MAAATKKNQAKLLANQKTMMATQKKILGNQADIKKNSKGHLVWQAWV